MDRSQSQLVLCGGGCLCGVARADSTVGFDMAPGDTELGLRSTAAYAAFKARLDYGGVAVDNFAASYVIPEPAT